MEITLNLFGLAILILLIYIQYWSVKYRKTLPKIISLIFAGIVCLIMIIGSNQLSGENYKLITFIVGFTLGLIMFSLCNNVLSSKDQEILLAVNNALVIGIYTSNWSRVGVGSALIGLFYLLVGYIAASIIVITTSKIRTVIENKPKNQEPA